MNSLILVTIFLFIYAAIISYFDIRYNKIFNKLTFSFLAIASAINCFMYSFSGFITSIEGILVGFVLLIVPFILGWVGAGDVKYLASVGALIGPWNILFSTIIGLILAGFASIIYLIVNKNLKDLLKELILLICFKGRGTNSIGHYGRLPLGVFLSTGIILVWLYLNFLMGVN